MEPTKALIDELYREEILRARQMSAEDKFLAGIWLFDSVCNVMADGIRGQYPDADESRVRQILGERLALARRLEDLP